MSFKSDSLAATVEDFVRSLSTGRKSIEVRTSAAGTKLFTIVDTPGR